jgi:hypothetical protein
MLARAPSLTATCALVAIFFLQACGPASSTQPAGGSPTAAVQPSTPALSPAIPPDLPANPTQADAVAFAWRSFVAVNWPNLALYRGTPDRNKTIGQPGDVVWHTWKAPDEIFYPDGSQPPPWNQYGGSLPPECTGRGAAMGDFVLRRVTKVPGDVRNNAIELAKEVVGGTLTDQQGNLARYEVRLNQTLFDAIVAHQYYNVQGQDRATSISFPSAVMEVKAAWREITPDEVPAIRLRYFRRNAWIYTPAFGPDPATCAKGEVGLVGLHITQKTPSRPQWIWATFEHIDNVPPFSNPQAPGPVPYSFDNPNCPPTKCVPNQSTESNGVPTGIPTQVNRTVNIGQDAQQANPVWQAALAKVPGSPFQFYQLVDVQWPQTPSQRPAGDPTPGLLANATMETYIPESSCLNCHFTARTASGKLSSDYSFMLAEAQPSATKAGR